MRGCGFVDGWQFVVFGSVSSLVRFAWRVSEFLGWCELCVVFSALVCVSGVGFVLDWDVSCFVCGGFLVVRADFRFGGGGCVWVAAFWLDLVWVLVDF